MYMSAKVISQMVKYWHLALLGNRPLSVLFHLVPRENLTDKLAWLRSPLQMYGFHVPTQLHLALSNEWVGLFILTKSCFGPCCPLQQLLFLAKYV